MAATLAATSMVNAEDTKTIVKEAAKDTEQAAKAAGVPLAGGTLKGVDVSVLGEAVTGWSVQKQIVGHEVVNESNDKVGKIEDIIIAPDMTASYAIIGVGGFLGMGEHKIAIATKYFQVNGETVLLDGATKDLLKQVPEFKYADK
jgi:hypothetical protein